jgi:hypothetical protein
MFKCLDCILWVFNCCLRFINKNAYVYVFVKSENFWTSAKNAVSLILTNPLKIASVSGVGEVIQLLGSLTVSVSTTYLSYYFLTQNPEYSVNVTNPIAASAVIGLLSLIVSSYFMSLFGSSAEIIIFLNTLDFAINGEKGALNIDDDLSFDQKIEQKQ